MIQVLIDSQLIQVGAETLTRSSTHGMVTKEMVGNAYEDFTYSSFGELSSITGKYNTTHVYSATYTRDALGRIVQINDKYGAAATQNHEYVFDSAGRLTDVKLGGTVVASYTYDSNSNRTSVTKGSTVNATYTSYDQLITYGTKTYTYNTNGELTSVVDSSSMPSGVHSYTYDTFGNLKTVTLPNADVITYVLDGLNHRTGVKLNGTLQKQYVWQDQFKIVAELDGSNNVTAEFIYGTGINVPDYMKKGGSVYKIITNHLGSVVAVVNTTTGAVAQQIVYDEFGNITSDTNPGFQPFGFAGGLYDNDTKLVHFNAREYDAETGRWMSKDPIGFNGGDTNLYGYVLQDPVNFVDPSGLLTPNAAPPRTIMPTGQNLTNMQCLESCLGGDLLVTGGQEQSGHTKNSKHSSNNACDIAGPNNGNPQTSDPNKVRQCAKSCGYSHGQFESFPSNPNRNHWHLQIGPGNGVPVL